MFRHFGVADTSFGDAMQQFVYALDKHGREPLEWFWDMKNVLRIGIATQLRSAIV